MKYIRKICNDKILESLFLLAVFIYSVKIAYKNSLLIEANSYQNFLIYHAIYFLCLPKVLLQKYDHKELIASIAIFVLAIIIHHFNPVRNMLVLPFMLVGVKGCNMKRLVKISFIVLVSFVIVHTVGYYYVHFSNGGTFFNIPWFERGPDRSTVLCKSYNNFGAITSMLTIQYLYLTDRNKNRHLKIFMLFVSSSFFYAIGTSRTSLIISLLSIMYLIVEKNNFISKNMRYIKIFSFFFLIIFSISMFYLDLSSPIVALLDRFLTTRIAAAQQANYDFPAQLIPRVAEFASGPIVLDNLVVFYIIVYGIILSSILAVYVLYFGVIGKQDNFTDYMMIVMFFWCITERYPTNIVLTLVPMLVMYNYYENS